MGIQPDHLVELAGGDMVAGQVFWKANAVSLVEIHGWRGWMGWGGSKGTRGLKRGNVKKILILA